MDDKGRLQVTTGGQGGVLHTTPPELVELNKWHLIWVLHRMRRRPFPTWEQVAIPFALFIGLFVTLLPADFQDTFGRSAETWESIVLVLTGVSAFATVVLLFWWLFSLFFGQLKPKNEEELYDELIDQMKADRQRFSDIESGMADQGE